MLGFDVVALLVLVARIDQDGNAFAVEFFGIRPLLRLDHFVALVLEVSNDFGLGTFILQRPDSLKHDIFAVFDDNLASVRLRMGSRNIPAASATSRRFMNRGVLLQSSSVSVGTLVLAS